jgi:signal peptidase I
MEKLKKFWNWLFHSESIWSYVVFLVLVFIIVKFIFLPGLGLIFGSSLPLAIVESSSMEHYSLKYCTTYNPMNFECMAKSKDYEICGKKFSDFQSFNLDKYWQTCGTWYEQNTDITKEQFSDFKFKNGFRKGDLMIIFGINKEEVKVGDVIIFNAGSGTPIIHRVISLEPLQTKGDHNSEQLLKKNNVYQTDETNIKSEQIIGVATLRIPYIGWVKLFFVEMLRKIF